MTEIKSTKKAYVNGMSKGGMKAKDIAIVVNLPLGTVYRIIREGYTEDEVPREQKRGRPPKFSERDIRSVVNFAKGQRRATLAEITNECNIDAHPNTIRKMLRNAGFNNRIARMKPFLMPRHIVMRKIFANEHLEWTLDDWKQVIWTDESTFELGKNYRQIRVWRKVNEEFDQDCIGSTFKSGRTTVMVWGAIAHGKKSELVILDKGKRTATDFVDQVYEGPLLGFMDGFTDPILMEDGAPIHRAKRSQIWRDEHDLQKLVWPAQSPDLNPIENLWAIMKNAVQKLHSQSDTTEDLIKNIKEAWENIPMETINHLVETMPARVGALSKNKGKSTRY